MKLSSETIAVLKNFSAINTGIQFVEGNEIRVSSKDKSVMGIATVQETFPRDFAIYNLSELLSIISLLDDPELIFEEDYLIIKKGRHRVKYFYTQERNVTAAPYDLELGGGEQSLFLSAEQLQQLQKAGAIMKLVDFSIFKEGETIQMIVEDLDQDSNHEFRIDLDYQLDCDDFDIQFKLKTLNFLPLDYEIELVAGNQFVVFSNDKNKVRYFVVSQD